MSKRLAKFVLPAASMMVLLTPAIALAQEEGAAAEAATGVSGMG